MSSPDITLLAKNEEYEFYRVKSFSDETLDYGVDIDHVENTVFCECPHFINRLQTERFGGAKLGDVDHHCKHIKEVKRYGKVE